MHFRSVFQSKGRWKKAQEFRHGANGGKDCSGGGRGAPHKRSSLFFWRTRGTWLLKLAEIPTIIPQKDGEFIKSHVSVQLYFQGEILPFISESCGPVSERVRSIFGCPKMPKCTRHPWHGPPTSDGGPTTTKEGGDFVRHNTHSGSGRPPSLVVRPSLRSISENEVAAAMPPRPPVWNGGKRE